MAGIDCAASLAGLVSLGLTVCHGLINYYNAYREAENDVKCLCDEINHLTQTLVIFESSIKESRIDTDQEAQVVALIESCRGRITDLDTQLKKLLKTRKDERRSARRTMSRTVRALYPFNADTLQKLRDKISKLNEILQQAGTSLLISQSHTIQDTIDRFYTKEDSKEIVRWLDPPNPRYIHLDASAKHQPGTGLWLIESLEFKEWKSSPSSVLWVQGGAGCGKTILSSHVINTLTEECETQLNGGLAYFYFDFNNQSVAQDHNRLLRSLIEQLSSQSGEIPKALSSLYQRCRYGTVQPMTSDLVKTLQNIVRDFAPFYLVIDAVDECKEKSQLLNFLNAIVQWMLPQIHILVTSRTDIETEIRNRKWRCITIAVEERSVDADVEKHVFATLESDEVLGRWDTSQQQAIAASLIKGASGNFRWVACQIGALQECHTVAELEEALSCLPPTLEDTYERALLAISENRKEAIRNVLRWLSFSARPILLEEIAEVMAIDRAAEPHPVYDARRRLNDPQRFFQTYSSLVRVLTVKSRASTHKELRLAHLSVRDYLVSSKIHNSPVSYYAVDSLAAHTSIAETCLIYLRQFDKPLLLSSMRPERYCLARYAAKHWPHHVQGVARAAAERLDLTSPGQKMTLLKLDQDAPAIALIIEFLLLILKVLNLSSTSAQVKNLPTDLNYLCTELLSAQDAQLQNQIRFYDPDTPWVDQPDIARTLNALPSALYYAAHAGLVGSVKLLLARGIDVNATGGRYGTALEAAASQGHADVVKMLLLNGADVNQTAGDYGNALQGACTYGHKTCADVLLQHGANVNAEGGEHFTALHAAAFNGYEQVALMLLENGAKIDPLDDEHRTPLIWAAAEGHTEIVKLLLAHGSDCMVQDEGGWTALDESAPSGFDAIVQTLINHHKPIIECRDYTNMSALHHTAGQRHDTTVHILLESGMEINVQGHNGRSALFQAVGSGHEPTIRLFLDYGADINMVDNSGWTVLHVAAHQGHVSVGALLLDRGADINSGPGGMTPLHIATLRKELDFVDLLLEYDADMIVNADGDTAFSICRFHDTGEATYVLQDLKIESYWATITGLRAAAYAGRDVRIRQLLERGADVNARDEGGMTALLWATNKKSLSTIKLLVENGADVNVKSDWGSTPMTYVCDDPELRAYLLANGYNMDTTGTVEEDPPEQREKDLPPEEDYLLDEIRRLLEERMNEPLTEDEDTLFTGSGSEGLDEV